MTTHDPHASALKLLASKRPLVIGHRGYARFAPENTLPSFELGIEAGADLIELDCRQSKDGVLMVIHDPDLNRTTDARKRWKQRHNPVDGRTAHEMKCLDAGSWFHPKFSKARIPLLAEALDLIQRRSVTLIEHKRGQARALVDLLREKRLINRVIIQSFDWAFLRVLHQLAPQQILGALGPPKALCNGRKPSALFRRLSGRWLREVQGTGARLVVWNQQISRKAVHLAQASGFKVWIYTVNTQRRANRLLKMGVDGVITDNVSVIWKTIALRSTDRS